MSERSPRWPEIYALTERTLREPSDLIRRATDERGWQSTYYQFPELLEPFRSGFPHISFGTTAKVPHYTDVIGVTRSQFNLLGHEDIPSFAELYDYVTNNEHLSTYLGLEAGSGEEVAEALRRITVAIVFFGLLERVLHLHGFDFTSEQLQESYLEIEAGLDSRKLRATVSRRSCVSARPRTPAPHILSNRKRAAPPARPRSLRICARVDAGQGARAAIRNFKDAHG